MLSSECLKLFSYYLWISQQFLNDISGHWFILSYCYVLGSSRPQYAINKHNFRSFIKSLIKSPWPKSRWHKIFYSKQLKTVLWIWCLTTTVMNSLLWRRLCVLQFEEKNEAQQTNVDMSWFSFVERSFRNTDWPLNLVKVKWCFCWYLWVSVSYRSSFSKD